MQLRVGPPVTAICLTTQHTPIPTPLPPHYSPYSRQQPWGSHGRNLQRRTRYAR